MSKHTTPDPIAITVTIEAADYAVIVDRDMTITDVKLAAYRQYVGNDDATVQDMYDAEDNTGVRIDWRR